MEDFNAHKWFKKQYLEEGMSDEEIQAIRRYEDLSADDKLKLAKIQKMMDREREMRDYYKGDSGVFPSDLKEDDLDEIAFGDAGTDKRTGQVASEIIELIRSTGVDPSDMMEIIGEEFGISFEFGRG